jgi:hypothetical protein
MMSRRPLGASLGLWGIAALACGLAANIFVERRWYAFILGAVFGLLLFTLVRLVMIRLTLRGNKIG